MEGMVGIFIWNPISERQVLGRSLGELKTGSAILNSSKTLLFDLLEPHPFQQTNMEQFL